MLGYRVLSTLSRSSPDAVRSVPSSCRMRMSRVCTQKAMTSKKMMHENMLSQQCMYLSRGTLRNVREHQPRSRSQQLVLAQHSRRSGCFALRCQVGHFLLCLLSDALIELRKKKIRGLARARCSTFLQVLTSRRAATHTYTHNAAHTNTQCEQNCTHGYCHILLPSPHRPRP